MNKVQPEITSIPTANPGTDRNAIWLLTDYSESIWNITDTWDKTRTATIDFNYKLADGRFLPNAERLYSTIKEYAFRVRDDRYASIDDAKTHVQAVRKLMHLAHALTLRKLTSFAQLQPYDLAQIVEECRYGLDAVLHASERVDTYLQSLAAKAQQGVVNRNAPSEYSGLPRVVAASSGRKLTLVSSSQIIQACNLPSAAAYLPCVSTLISKAAKANGLRTKSGKYDSKDSRPTENVTVQALQRWLSPIEQLYSMRRRINAESIGFKPFPQGSGRIAAVKGIGTDRTPTPPPKLALYLLEKSASWIFEQKPAAV